MDWQRYVGREKSDGDVVKPFLEHMEDLRWVVIKIVVTMIVSMGVIVGSITISIISPIYSVIENIK